MHLEEQSHCFMQFLRQYTAWNTLRPRLQCIRVTGRGKLCGAPQGAWDECSCPCFYDAYWSCSEDRVVCMATRTGESVPGKVGDLVCSHRGGDKPLPRANSSSKPRNPLHFGTIEGGRSFGSLPWVH